MSLKVVAGAPHFCLAGVARVGSLAVVALTGERSTVEARTATGGFRDRRPIAVAGFAPFAMSLVASFLLPLGAMSVGRGRPGRARSGQGGRAHGQGQHRGGPHPPAHRAAGPGPAAGQLDLGRVWSASPKQHDTTMQVLGANRAILLEQAVRAYMHGGATPGMPSAAAVDRT